MRAVLALDKFKGTFSAQEACEYVAKGIHHRNPKIDVSILPMADGGEGTSQILSQHLGMETMRVVVPNLSAAKCEASILWHHSRRLAVIESASVLGIRAGPIQEEFFLQSSSAPLGLLMQKALDLRPKEMWIAIGGTLTADAGWGLASVFGLKAFDAHGNLLSPSISNMEKIAFIRPPDQTTEALNRTRIAALCDVNAPAAPVCPVSLASFLQQKGAAQHAIPLIEKSILGFAAMLRAACPNTLTPSDSFTGAGGGMCMGLSSVCHNLKMESGAHRVAQANSLANHLVDADVVVCGEGRLDNQTFFGKAPFVIAQLAQKSHVPVFGVFGCSKEHKNTAQSRLGLQEMNILFEKLPHSHSELIRQSRIRLFEAGISIAHWIETTLPKS